MGEGPFSLGGWGGNGGMGLRSSCDRPIVVKYLNLKPFNNPNGLVLANKRLLEQSRHRGSPDAQHSIRPRLQ